MHLGPRPNDCFGSIADGRFWRKADLAEMLVEAFHPKDAQFAPLDAHSVEEVRQIDPCASECDPITKMHSQRNRRFDKLPIFGHPRMSGDIVSFVGRKGARRNGH